MRIKMENKQAGEAFTYTYSGKEQNEIKRIRQKYMVPEENKMEKLRRLDAGVTQKGMAISLTNGVIGALMLGIGMCCATVWKGSCMIPGIFTGIIGMVFMSSGYPIYNRVVKKERAKIAPEILKLADELMK